MKILFICSGNFEGKFKHNQVFIYEQYQRLIKLGLNIDIFLIKGKGLIGYVKSMFRFWLQILKKKYDIIHAFYGLSGFFSCFQFSIPVIITFLGSDINNEKIKPFSKIAYLLSKYSVFVEKRLADLLGAKYNYEIVPFGVDLEQFFPIKKEEARKKLRFPSKKKVVMFSSSFTRIEKNYDLAKEALALISENVKIIELGKEYSRSELNSIYNASDLFLMTSISEGSPQTIKEAMACSCPIVSTDVGDVKEIIKDTRGCYITSFDPNDIAEKIKLALGYGKRTNGREKIKHLDDKIIAQKIIEIYQKVISKV